MELLNGAYLWLNAIHVVASIIWIAGMLYLPTLFGYHAEAAIGTPQSETFKRMERRLLRRVINPGMLLCWGFGLIILLMPITNAWHLRWFQAKFALVMLLSVFHAQLVRWTREFWHDERLHSARYFRLWNQVPLALMAAIVVLVLVRPI